MTQSSQINVTDELRELASNLKVKLEEVQEEYYRVYESDFIKTSSQFPTEEAKHDYSKRVAAAKLSHRPSVDEYTVVPVGFSGFRKDRGGKLYSEVFVLILEPEKERDEKIHKVQIYHEPGTFKELTYEPPHAYKVKLQPLGGDDFRAPDHRSKWSNGESLGDIEPLESIPEIRIANLPSHVAEKRGKYNNYNDWRCVSGIVDRCLEGEREDGTEWARFEVNDQSLFEAVAVDDKVDLKPNLAVWTTPELLPPEGSDCKVFGPVLKGDREFTMNGYMVRTIIEGPGPEAEE